MLANHPRKALSDIIFGNQSAFVDDQQILESVITAHECIDSRYKQNSPGVVCKLVFENPYDRVD